MHAEGQAVAGGVDLFDQPLQLVAVIAHHVQHRAEDLFFQLVEAVELNERRRNESTAGPLAGIFAVFAHRLEDFAPFGAQRLDVALDILFGFGVNHRPDIGGQTPRVAHPALGHRAAQHGQRMVGDIILQAEYAQGGATLSGAVERRGENVDHHLFS